MEKALILRYPLSTQQRLRSVWAFAQFVQSLLCAESNCWFCRDGNHSGFCGIIIFKADFRIMVLEVKIPANNDFKMVPDKIKEVTSTCTPIWIPENIMLEVEVKLSAMPCAGGIGFCTRRY